MDVLLLLMLLTVPLLAGIGLVVFMASGKGKPAPETHEILAVKESKRNELKVQPQVESKQLSQEFVRDQEE
jgi:hypothetical protein